MFEFHTMFSFPLKKSDLREIFKRYLKQIFQGILYERIHLDLEIKGEIHPIKWTCLHLNRSSAHSPFFVVTGNPLTKLQLTEPNTGDQNRSNKLGSNSE